MEDAEFDGALGRLAQGYGEGVYEGRRYGVTVRRSADGRRNSLFARELAGTDIVSFNLYRTASDRALQSPARCPLKRSWRSCWSSGRMPEGRLERAASALTPRPSHVPPGYQNNTLRPLDFAG